MALGPDGMMGAMDDPPPMIAAPDAGPGMTAVADAPWEPASMESMIAGAQQREADAATLAAGKQRMFDRGAQAVGDYFNPEPVTPADIAQADGELAQAGYAAPAQPTLDLIGKYGLGNLAESERLQAELDANPVRYGSKANVYRPGAEQAAGDFFGREGVADVGMGPFQPTEFNPDDFPRGNGEPEDAYLDRMQGLQSAHAAREAMAANEHNATLEQLRDEAATTVTDVRKIGDPGYIGMGEADVTTAENVGEADIAQQEQMLSVLEQQNAEIAKAEGVRVKAGAEIQKRKEQELDAVRAAQETEQTIRAELDSQPEFSTKRYFSSLGGGQKFFAVLGALAGGWIGSDSMLQQIERQALQGHESQRQNLRDRLDAAKGGVQQADGVYQRAYDLLGDESVAKSMDLQFAYEDAERILKEELARTTIPLAQAEIERVLVGVEKKRLAEGAKIDLVLRTTPGRIATSYDPLGGRNRRAKEKRLGELGKRRDKLADDAIDATMDTEKMAAASRDKAATGDIKEREFAYKQQRDIDKDATVLSKDISAGQGLVEELGELMREGGESGDVPGLGFAGDVEEIYESVKGKVGGVDRAHRFRKKTEAVVDRILRWRTGAAAQDFEIQQTTDAIMEGGQDMGGESKFRENIKALQSSIAQEVKMRTRGATDAAINRVTRSDVQPTTEPIQITSGSREDPTVRK